MNFLRDLGITDAHSFRKWARDGGHPDKGGDTEFFKKVYCAYDIHIVNNAQVDEEYFEECAKTYQTFKNYTYKAHEHKHDFWVNRAERDARPKIKKETVKQTCEQQTCEQQDINTPYPLSYFLYDCTKVFLGMN